jgi:hypothetical protein
METDPDSETLCFLVFRIPDDGQSPEHQQFFLFIKLVIELIDWNLAKSVFLWVRLVWSAGLGYVVEEWSI